MPDYSNAKWSWLDYATSYIAESLRTKTKKDYGRRDTSNYPQFVPILNVPKRNPLRGCFCTVTSVNDLPDVVDMFVTLGICMTDDIARQIEEIVINKQLRNVDMHDAVYLGVDLEDTFIISNPSNISSMSNLKILDPNRLLNNSSYIGDDRQNTAYRLETEAIARAFFTALDKHGYSQDSGDKWIDTEGNFPYPYGKDTVVCANNGKVMSYQEAANHYYSFIYAHNRLFGMENETFFKWNIPEGGYDYNGLVQGRAYVKRSTIRQPDNGTDHIIIFNGDLDSYQDAIDRYGDYRTNSANLRSYSPYCYYEKITRGHELYDRYKRAYDEHQRRLEDMRRRERAIYLEERKEKLKRKRNNIDTYNRDVQTQLLSESLHKMLTKALDNKVARCLLKLNKVGYLDGSVRNITIRRSDKEMTYMPSGKPTEMASDNTWVAKGRQNGKYGKVIRKVLKEQVPRLKFTDHEIEKLVNHLKAQASDGEFEVVSGEDIAYWYDGRRYNNEVELGTLSSSCMRDSSCKDSLDIYVKNPDKVKMVILTKDDLLIGRALVWDDKWMDRIYGTDSIASAFKTFAKEKGWHAKSSQNSDPDQGWIHPETGESYNEVVTIELETNFDEYPYADTFCYLDRSNGKVSNDTRDLGSYAEMRDTGGGLEGDDERQYDEYDDRYIDTEDAVYVESHGFYTHYDNTFVCEVDDCRYLKDDRVETHDGRYVYDGNAHYNQTEGVYYTDEDETYQCAVDRNEYLEDMTPSVYIEELDLTVASGNEDRAYEDAGYEMIDGSWQLPEEA